jgi:hypothetical protein
MLVERGSLRARFVALIDSGWWGNIQIRSWAALPRSESKARATPPLPHGGRDRAPHYGDLDRRSGKRVEAIFRDEPIASRPRASRMHAPHPSLGRSCRLRTTSSEREMVFMVAVGGPHEPIRSSPRPMRSDEAASGQRGVGPDCYFIRHPIGEAKTIRESIQRVLPRTEWHLHGGAFDDGATSLELRLPSQGTIEKLGCAVSGPRANEIIEVRGRWLLLACRRASPRRPSAAARSQQERRCRREDPQRGLRRQAADPLEEGPLIAKPRRRPSSFDGRMRAEGVEVSGPRAHSEGSSQRPRRRSGEGRRGSKSRSSTTRRCASTSGRDSRCFVAD